MGIFKGALRKRGSPCTSNFNRLIRFPSQTAFTTKNKEEYCENIAHG